MFVPEPVVEFRDGIPDARFIDSISSSPWERRSLSLEVSSEYETIIFDFKEYFEVEMKSLQDDSLSREVLLMESLLS